MATLHAEIPQQLWQQAQNMVDRGWVNNLDALVSESLQRYLESHQEAMTEQFIREDVEWGLRGHVRPAFLAEVIRDLEQQAKDL